MIYSSIRRRANTHVSMGRTLSALTFAAVFVALGGCRLIVGPELTAPTVEGTTDHREVRLTWAGRPGVDAYIVYRFRSADDATDGIAANADEVGYAFTSDSDGQFVYIDNDTEPGITAYYRVAPLDAVTGAPGPLSAPVPLARPFTDPEWTGQQNLGGDHPTFTAVGDTTPTTILHGSTDTGDEARITIRGFDPADQVWNIYGGAFGLVDASAGRPFALAADPTTTNPDPLVAYVDAEREGVFSFVRYRDVDDPDDTDNAYDGEWTRDAGLSFSYSGTISEPALTTLGEGSGRSLVLAYRHRAPDAEDASADTLRLTTPQADGWTARTGDGDPLAAGNEPTLLRDGDGDVTLVYSTGSAIRIRRSANDWAAVDISATPAAGTLTADLDESVDDAPLYVAWVHDGQVAIRRSAPTDGPTAEVAATGLPSGTELYDPATSASIAVFTGEIDPDSDGQEDEVSLMLRSADGTAAVYRGVYRGGSATVTFDELRAFTDDDEPEEVDLTPDAVDTFRLELRGRDLFAAYVEAGGGGFGGNARLRLYR